MLIKFIKFILSFLFKKSEPTQESQDGSDTNPSEFDN